MSVGPRCFFDIIKRCFFFTFFKLFSLFEIHYHALVALKEVALNWVWGR